MCFGIAWGLRNGYLPQRTYKPVLEKGWQSLIKAVHADGKFGYIQPVKEQHPKLPDLMQQMYME